MKATITEWSSELRLAIYIATLYAVFIYWGYLQEKIASTHYSAVAMRVSDDAATVTSSSIQWSHPFVLNLFMSISTCLTAQVIDLTTSRAAANPYAVSGSSASDLKLYWRPALSATLASPMGYYSLKYISYPLMVLAKSSKPVPVMVVGRVMYKQVYQWYKYLSIGLLCTGLFVFTFMKHSSKNETNSILNQGVIYSLYGVVLIFINLFLDGYTNNQQDFIFSHHGATSTQMMKYTNCWQCIYQIIYLGGGYILQSSGGEAAEAYHMVMHCPLLKYDILLFCVCASIGQVILFKLMKEFGSLVWVTVSITRQLCTIVLSVVIFGHKINTYQWLGVALVFIGLAVEVFYNQYYKKVKKSDTNSTSKPSSGRHIARRKSENSPLNSSTGKLWTERTSSNDSEHSEDLEQNLSAKKKSS